MENYSFFDNVNQFVDQAGKYLQIQHGLLEQIKECNSIYKMHFPVKMDNGDYQVITAF